VVTAARAPISVATRWRQRHPCPVTTTSTAARTRNGAGAGSSLANGRTRSPRPLRALRRRHPWSFMVNHGESKPLLDGSVCPSQVVPKLTINRRCLWQASAPGGPRPGPKVVSHQLRGIPPRRQRRHSRPGAGVHVVQPSGAPHGPLPLARSEKAADATGYPLTHSHVLRQIPTSHVQRSCLVPLACPFPRGLTGNHGQ
jgi:hypothetical protein